MEITISDWILIVICIIFEIGGLALFVYYLKNCRTGYAVETFVICIVIALAFIWFCLS